MDKKNMMAVLLCVGFFLIILGLFPVLNFIPLSIAPIDSDATPGGTGTLTLLNVVLLIAGIGLIVILPVYYKLKH